MPNMMRWTWLPVVGIGAMSAAHGTQYHTLESVQKQLFPQAQVFNAQVLLMTEAQRNSVEQLSSVRVRDAHVRAWEVMAQGARQGWVLLDKVLGKHEQITYAIALDARGVVLGVEIMEYQETYGGQISDARWRDQFKGKTAKDPIKVESDIRNISGATLSCQHVTDGVRRLVATWQTVLASPR
jgi:Na+-translocating ferredoxin:NAD+ oxidoreductase RnfG subunit